MGNPRSVTRGKKPTPLVNSKLKIHPAIGIARVGNDPTFFLGPEIPGQGPVGAANGVGSSISGGAFSGFKTSATSVKPQAQRFYIFMHQSNAAPIEVNALTPQVKSIEWSVHLANKKATFFQFDGQTGNSGGVYSPGARQNKRNGIDNGKSDLSLAIDPKKPQTISGISQAAKKIDSSMGGNWPKHRSTKAVVISQLGALSTDDAGRLVVTGGLGLARPFQGTTPPPMLTYANNDGWLDDVSDGSVTAKVTMADGTVVLAQQAWLLVAPPDFAPEIGQVVSLYDTLWDVAARNASITIPSIQMFNVEPLNRLATFRNNHASYKPEWFSDIEPLLRNTLRQQFVFPGISHGMAGSSLTNKAEGGALQFLRPPAGNQVFTMALASMPLLFGDDYGVSGSNKQALAVTESQWENLNLWKAGTFDTLSAPTGVTPQGLDRAALESCVGGAFFPGIEASWMIRNASLYAEPFRLKPVGTVLNASMSPPLKIEPGLFSQQMALPWHADFFSCKAFTMPGSSSSQLFGWWPAQRPDTVLKAGNPVAWDRNIGTAQNALVNNWMTRGFVIKNGSSFEEQGGP